MEKSILMEAEGGRRESSSARGEGEGELAAAVSPGGLKGLGRRFATFVWYVWGEITNNKRIFPG